MTPDPFPGLSAADQPHRRRIHTAATSDPLRPGDKVSLKAKLYPVPAQILPGGRDMQRELYFAGIGGVGYSFGGARRIASAEEQPAGGWREWVLQLRTEMTERIHAVLPGATGGVASAGVTRQRGPTPEEGKQGFRDSGRSRLFAISGVPPGLFWGFVVFAL